MGGRRPPVHSTATQIPLRQDVIAEFTTEIRTRRGELAVVPPLFESAHYSLVAAKPEGEAAREQPETVAKAIHFRKFDQGGTKGGHLP